MFRFRSLFNTPGSRPDLLKKAPGFGADALIIDWQDSVPVEKKAYAREVAADVVPEWAERGIPTMVRVNDSESGFLDDDLDAVVSLGVTAIQVPQVDAAETVVHVAHRLDQLESEREVSTTTELLVSIESAVAVVDVRDILSVSSRASCVMIGTAEHGDLQREVGHVPSETEEELLYPRAHVLYVARALGIENPIDGVYADYRNVEGLAASCRNARRLGYRGKKAIHPSQVEVINRSFSYTEDELAFYAEVLEAFEQALSEGRATGVVRGRMIDYAMAETARSALSWEREPGE